MDFRKDYDWSVVEDAATDEEIRTLCAALRSGEYNQIRGQLSYSNEIGLEQSEKYGFEYKPVEADQCGHCVLGVANIVWNVGMPYDHAVLARYPEDSATVYLKLPQFLQESLYKKNDSLSVSFEGFADYIEKGFGLV